MTGAETEIRHASCVAINGRAVLLIGPSGAGKSDLALRLIDRGAMLVSDDYTQLIRDGETILASPPDRIAGQIEIRGIGIVARPFVGSAPLAMIAMLSDKVERYPFDQTHEMIFGLAIACHHVAPLEASAPIKVELMLERIEGL